MLEKITAEQLVAKGVVSAPDKLKGNPKDNKYIFDGLVAEVVAPIVNACIDTVNGVAMQEETIVKNEEERQAAEEQRQAAEEERQDLESGYVVRAENAAEAAEASQVAAKTSEDAAAESARRAAQAMLGQIADGSLTMEKFIEAIQEAIQRAMPGGAIDQSLAKKAPAGFGGYGEALERFHTATDVELFSALDAKLALLPNGSAMRIAVTSNETFEGFQYDGTLEKFSDTLAVFKGITYGFSSTGSTIREPYEVVISKTNAVWIIEWVNPPMFLGVEYRTTERYNGKPVYVKAVDFGPLPNNCIGYTGVAGSTARVFNAYGIMTYANGEKGTLPGYDTSVSNTLPIEVFGYYTQVYIRTQAEYPGNTAVIVARYTKTTG